MVPLGCGHGKDAADRQIDQLREQLTKVQADHDRFDERLGALETAESRREEANRSNEAAGGHYRPKLRVVRVGPDGKLLDERDTPPDEIVGDADDPQPRQKVESSGRVDRASSADAKRAYGEAVALLKAKDFDKAIDAFAAFLVRFPDNPNADDAMYERGTCYVAKGDYARTKIPRRSLATRTCATATRKQNQGSRHVRAAQSSLPQERSGPKGAS
jgi:TolA-binding protein